MRRIVAASSCPTPSMVVRQREVPPEVKTQTQLSVKVRSLLAWPGAVVRDHTDCIALREGLTFAHSCRLRIMVAEIDVI
ncbi:hypothetical protein L484_025342 [Morus notabilis]|uniref:Uncharacterized protein n=1 Tax=Morus notabilis TaxID=981085 RepID=W9RQM4_9ROSA|nr:hypothetical protein L484_025342 [Morus notabilis]